MDLSFAGLRPAPRANRAGCLFSLLALCALSAAGEEGTPPASPPAAEPAPAAGAEAKAKGPEPGEDPATVITGTPPAFPLQARYDEILDSYDDSEEAQKIQSTTLEDFLIALRASTQEHLVSNLSPKMTFEALMKEPEKHRGEVVRLSGCLRRLKMLNVPANKSGLRQVWQGHVTTSKGYVITFCSIEPPPAGLKIGTGVQFTGVFMQRFAYLNEDVGDKLTWSPLVFVRQVRAYSDLDTIRSTKWFGFDPLEIILTLLVGGVVAYLVYTRSKHRLTSGNQFTRRKQEDKKKGSAEQLLGDDAPRNIPRPPTS